MAVRDVRFTIRARDATLGAFRSLGNSLRRLRGFITGMALRLTSLATAFGAAFGVGAVTRLSSALKVSADRLGINEEEAQGLRAAAKALGIDYRTLVSVIQRSASIRGDALAGNVEFIERLTRAGLADEARSTASNLDFFFSILRKGAGKTGPELNAFLRQLLDIEGVTIGGPIIRNIDEFFSVFEQGTRDAFDITPLEAFRKKIVELALEMERAFAEKLAIPLTTLITELLPRVEALFEGIAKAVTAIGEGLRAASFLFGGGRNTRRAGNTEGFGLRGLQGQRREEVRVARATLDAIERGNVIVSRSGRLR